MTKKLSDRRCSIGMLAAPSSYPRTQQHPWRRKPLPARPRAQASRPWLRAALESVEKDKSATKRERMERESSKNKRLEKMKGRVF